MSSTSTRSPGLWAAAALGLGAVSMGVNLANRRQQRRWRDNPDPLQGRAPRFPPGREQVVDLDDGAQIHTVRAGNRTVGARNRPIVLVHGLTSNIDDWGPVADRLVGHGLDVIGLDLRGHGRSTLGDAPYTPARLASDLALVLAALDLDRAVVVGHSMGGMAALALAVDHPELVGSRIGGLALLSSAARLHSIRYRVTIPVGALLPGFVTGALHQTTAALGVAALSAFGPDPSIFMLRQAVDSFTRCPDATRRAATAGLVGFDVLDDLAGITVPTLVLTGTHDLILPPAESDAIAAAIPGARLVSFPDAGHIITWERPDEVAAELVRLHREAAG